METAKYWLFASSSSPPAPLPPAPMEKVAKLLLGLLMGGLVGFLVAAITTLGLLEISTSGFFAVILGMGLIVLSLLIMWRVASAPESRNSLSKYFVLGFALLVFASGVFCFMLEKDWFTGIKATSKVPMYALLGGALSFALSFSIIDLLNAFVGYCSGAGSRQAPLVANPTQICVVLLAALCCGLYFGVLFGELDIEDDDKKHTRYHLGLAYALPVGVVLGAIVGVINVLVTKTRHYDPLDTFDEPYIA